MQNIPEMDSNITEDSSIENTTLVQINYIKGAIEALLFVSEKPLTLAQLTETIETVEISEVKVAVQTLQDDYDQRGGGLTIEEVAGGYQMLSNPLYAVYIRNLYKTKQKEKLSKPALESMAIIAYKQPVTRADIELIRGVNSDGVVAHLLNKELIKVVGRKEVAGRPFLYGTSVKFLEYFGLKSLADLPKLEEFPALVEKREQAMLIEKEEIVNVDVSQEFQGNEPQVTGVVTATDNQEDGDESLNIT